MRLSFHCLVGMTQRSSEGQTSDRMWDGERERKRNLCQCQGIKFAARLCELLASIALICEVYFIHVDIR